jgi:1,4-alpha-glucan branching enzyme
MGGNLIPGGATFRAWAPNARNVAVIFGNDLNSAASPGWQPADTSFLARQADDTWTGFFPGFVEGSAYRFWVQGAGSEGLKRDPHARELQVRQPLSNCDCLLRDPGTYPWHDAAHRPPPFNEVILYQLHVGTFYGVDANGQDKRRSVAKFLDVLDRMEYLRDLGINTVQLLPIQEYPSDTSMGYNGTDYFAPEMAYEVFDPNELLRYLTKANTLLAQHGAAPLSMADLLPGMNQLKCLVDIFHLNGISVIFDIVYNHAGGDFGDQSLYFFDRQMPVTNNNSLYFTDQGWAGGLVFAYWNPGVRQLLIDDARFLYSEYHVDGLRYDEVSVIDNHGGWFFCQDITSTLRFIKPEAIQIAEYWNPDKWKAVAASPVGMGFDAALGDGLRDSLRAVIQQATYGQSVPLSWNDVAGALYPPYGFPDAWRIVQCIENQDIVYADRPPADWKPRVAALADPSDHRSWYARSRSRVATGVILTAPGIPMLFMGEEILEDKDWSDNPGADASKLIWWDGLTQDSNMSDFLQFCRGMIAVRKRYPALSGPNVRVFHNYGNRVLGFHRWMEGSGNDVIVVANLNEFNLYNYAIGLPWPGTWREVFNSDYFDRFPNPNVAGNGGSVDASGGAQDGFGCSTSLVLPANGLLILARES